MTELEQFLFGPADLSDMRDFSNIAVFMDFNIPVTGTILGPNT